MDDINLVKRPADLLPLCNPTNLILTKHHPLAQLTNDYTFESEGIHIGAELSLTSNLIMPRPQRADSKKQHSITVHGLLAIP